MVMNNKIYAMLTDLQAMSEQNIHAYHRSSHKRKMNHTIFERRKIRISLRLNMYKQMRVENNITKQELGNKSLLLQFYLLCIYLQMC